MNKKFLLSLPVCILLASCGGEGDEPEPTPPPAPPVEPVEPVQPEGYKLTSKKRVFGFTTQARYAYCPSALELPDGTTSIFFCGNPQAGTMVDNIYNFTLNSDMTRSNPVSVLQPGEAGTWDAQHTCDPSVVKGRFRFGGTDYSYAMFYLGCTVNHYYNEVGVAFANEPGAKQWAKYPEPIVRKTWSGDADQEYAPGQFSWGTGQPSAISLDKNGKLLLTYTAGDKDGTRILIRELDLSDMDNPVIGEPLTMATAGLMDLSGNNPDYSCNSDIALDTSGNAIVMVRPVQPHPSTYPAFINESLEIDRMPLDDFRRGTGKWEALFRLTPAETGYPRNHNACVSRDEYGHMSTSTELKVFYTVSKESPDVSPTPDNHAEWSYDIWQAIITDTPE